MYVLNTQTMRNRCTLIIATVIAVYSLLFMEWPDQPGPQIVPFEEVYTALWSLVGFAD